MPRRSRRTPTYPPHDPRAQHLTRRAELAATAKSRRTLDDIDFTIDTTANGEFGLEVVVNGVSTVRDLGHATAPARWQSFPLHAMRDHDGSRDVWVASCSCGEVECGGLRARIEVAGRLVRWRLDADAISGEFLFDRALYRERYEDAMARYRAVEPEPLRRIRDFIERTPWIGPDSMGLDLDELRVADTGLLVARFLDDFWHTIVQLQVPWDLQHPEQSAREASIAIASWDVDGLDVAWRYRLGEEDRGRPPYPDSWRRIERR